MCLLGIQFQAVEEVPVLLLANREESYSRPATPPVLHLPGAGGLAWFGGTDLVAGGTWLGVNSRKLIVAVTNRRMGRVVVPQRSRGKL